MSSASRKLPRMKSLLAFNKSNQLKIQMLKLNALHKWKGNMWTVLSLLLLQHPLIKLLQSWPRLSPSSKRNYTNFKGKLGPMQQACRKKGLARERELKKKKMQKSELASM